MAAAFECSCAGCASACRTRPGLFMPGEAEALAGRMGISFDTLFKTRLMTNRIACQPHDVIVLSPGIVEADTGAELAQDRRGTCVFFEDGLCSIHTLGKPHECAGATHTGGPGLMEIVNAWGRRAVLTLAALLVAVPAWAQGLPATEQRVKLDLTVEQAMLIVQALPLIGCQTVAQWAGCQAAFELLREIKRQAAEQEKK